ncbi:MAG: twin-arginine translocase TatA/TatE family subunit [Actinomycetota bacterium]|nr:twin-arginine translocase TatA/TatE family subunit [Actinomycetota bacterium]
MGNLGLGEMLLIAIVGLLVFGPDKLPEIMRNVGKVWRGFQLESQKAADMFRDSIEPRSRAGVIDHPDPDPGPVAPPPHPVAEPAAAEPDRTYEDT